MINRTSIYFLPFTFFLFVGCSESKPKENNTQKSDTIVNEQLVRWEDFNLVAQTEDSLVSIDDKSYTLTWRAELDTSRQYVFSEVFSKDGKNYKNVLRGYNLNYSFSLLDSKKNEIFTTYVSKENFEKLFDGMVLAESDAHIPKFLGFLEKFNSFLFTVNFWKPESDVGEQCVLLLDKSGEMKTILRNTYFGGRGCEENIEVSPNGEFILTCEDIIHLDGKVNHISTDGQERVATKIINDKFVLLVTLYNDTTNRNNASLLDIFGNKKLSFTYKGYYNEMDYSLPYYVDSLTNAIYLLDDPSASLRIISTKNPLETHALEYKRMPRSEAAVLENESAFILNGENTENVFYVDTLTQKIRKASKVNY